MQTIDIQTYLEDLENRIDAADEESLYDQWRVFARGEFTGDVFEPRRRECRPPKIEWPHVLVDDALDDINAMVLQQLGACSALLASGGGLLMAVRANYGTPIIPSLFGALVHRMEREIDTLPCSHPIPRPELEAALEKGAPDLTCGLGRSVFEAGRRFRELLAGYPKVSKHVHLYHPDTQGPMDICEMMRGSAIFEDAYEDPEFLHRLLRLVTDTYLAFIREWQAIAPDSGDGCAVHWAMMHRGSVMLRDDSAMNFSASMYEEFICPYDAEILAEFGGGAMHFCGKGDHFIEIACSIDHLYAVNLSQPHLNDMEKIFRATIDRGIQIIGFPLQAARELGGRGRSFHGNVHAM